MDPTPFEQALGRVGDRRLDRSLDIAPLSKKNELKPWRKKQWCIASKQSAAFVCSMEDVLEVYQRERDPDYPLVCLDETTKELHGHSREPMPVRPSQIARVDSEYLRAGVGTLFMLNAPLEGWREVIVTERKTRQDYAKILRKLSDECFPDAKKIILVQDNLNTHNPTSLYETFPAQEARRLAERFEVHYTPKHGSWLNMAEIELNVLSSQCLSCRIPNMQRLCLHTKAWVEQRNRQKAKIQWRFRTSEARIKLQHLYPKFV